MPDVLIYKTAKGTIKNIGRKKIIVSRYPNVKKDSVKLYEYLVANKFEFFKYDYSPTTKSYYFEAENENIIINIRVSNHTKPDETEYKFLEIQPFLNYMNFQSSVVNKIDFDEMFSYLTTLVNSYK